LPGEYTVKLTVDGKSYTQPLAVKMDPRIKTPLVELEKQFSLGAEIAQRQSEVNATLRQVEQFRSQLQQRSSKVTGDPALAGTLAALDRTAESIGGTRPTPVAPGNEPEPPKERSSLTFLSGQLAQIASAVNAGDSAPTAEAVSAFAEAQSTLSATMEKWTVLRAKDVPGVNQQLKQAGLEPLTTAMALPQGATGRNERTAIRRP
jgi:hypothetical protein